MAGFKTFLFNSIHLTQTIWRILVTMLPELRGMLLLRTGIMVYSFCSLMGLMNGHFSSIWSWYIRYFMPPVVYFSRKVSFDSFTCRSSSKPPSGKPNRKDHRKRNRPEDDELDPMDPSSYSDAPRGGWYMISLFLVYYYSVDFHKLRGVCSKIFLFWLCATNEELYT